MEKYVLWKWIYNVSWEWSLRAFTRNNIYIYIFLCDDTKYQYITVLVADVPAYFTRSKVFNWNICYITKYKYQYITVYIFIWVFGIFFSYNIVVWRHPKRCSHTENVPKSWPKGMGKWASGFQQWQSPKDVDLMGQMDQTWVPTKMGPNRLLITPSKIIVKAWTSPTTQINPVIT